MKVKIVGEDRLDTVEAHDCHQDQRRKKQREQIQHNRQRSDDAVETNKNVELRPSVLILWWVRGARCEDVRGPE